MHNYILVGQKKAPEVLVLIQVLLGWLVKPGDIKDYSLQK